MPNILSRRATLGGLIACSATIACSAATPPDGVKVTDHMRAGEPDDSAAFARALATGRPVHCPAGGGSGPGGRYMVSNNSDVLLASGATITGDGIGKTVIARSYARPGSFLFFADSKSADPAQNITGITFRDLTLEDDVVTRGFAEFDYLVMLSGASGVLFERVEFRGFRGDGLHLGSSTISEIERHNRDVTVRDCRFDGINRNNRNAISVIDCEGLLVERCTFANVSRPGNGTPGAGDPMNPATGAAMPGAIDLEPNGDAFAIVRNVMIRDNQFRGGGGFAVALLLRSNKTLRVPQRNIVVRDNLVEDNWGGFGTGGFTGSEALEPDAAPYTVEFSGNRVRRTTKPLLIDGMRGLVIRDNEFTDSASMGEIGYRFANADVTVSRNRFTRLGAREAGYGLWLRRGNNITFENNDFVDCGLANGTLGIPLALVEGVITRLKLIDNRFTSPQGRSTQALLVFRDAKLDHATLIAKGNQIGFKAPPIATALNTPAR